MNSRATNEQIVILSGGCIAATIEVSAFFDTEQKLPQATCNTSGASNKRMFAQAQCLFRNCFYSLTCTFLITLLALAQCFGYSVLTHQQIIDLVWGSSIRPLLVDRYPNATAEQLRNAQAYAYGGCEIQDAGYYPFGRALFSNLTHYIRTGDFIASLIRDAKDVNELAFALGALSHYVGDSIGHHDAVNPSTAIAFPNLERQFGKSVTYDESPHGHVRTEFAFDIDQLTKEHFAPAAYLQRIGLQVSTGLLDRAFYDTYGLHLQRILGDKRRTAVISSYRHSVRGFLPSFAHAEALIHRNDFPAEDDSAELQKFNQRLQHADYNNGWQYLRQKPGVKTHLLAFVVIIVPKIGAASDLSIKIPTQETEAKYIASVNRTLDLYDNLLAQLKKTPQQDPEITMNLDNRDLDTGYIVQPGAYPLTDKTYAQLLAIITTRPTEPAPSGLKRDILAYYSDPNAPIITKKNAKAWKQVQDQLAILQNMPVVPIR